MTNLSRALAYLNKLPSANSGSGGHNATLRAACECARFGLSESEMWEAMSWYNSNRCTPAWSERELRHKIDDAQKIVGTSGATRAGNKSARPSRVFTPPTVTVKRKAKPIIQQGHAAEEKWWSDVAAGLGMTLAEFDTFCGNSK